MGYTRYWNRTNKEFTEDFIAEVQEVLADCAQMGIILKDGFGENEPVVNMNEIWFNGNRATGLEHETFYIPNVGYEYYEEGFNFCKTARKPYDYAVRRVLAIADKYGIVKDVRSDGPNDAVISDAEYLS